MKNRLTKWLALAMLIVIVTALSSPTFAGDKEQRQVTDNDIAAVCEAAPAIGGESPLGRIINLERWLWGDTGKRVTRYAALTPPRGGSAGPVMSA